jgi:RNase adaptor protein for sRNA GlmZ degradation
MAQSSATFRIFVYRLQEVPFDFDGIVLDVANTFPLNARSDFYDLSAVTGADLRIQAILSCQIQATHIIEEVVIAHESRVRSGLPSSIAFCCDGGTHRSFGIACLLARLVYPAASITPTTKRTVAAATMQMMRCGTQTTSDATSISWDRTPQDGTSRFRSFESVEE